MTSKVSIANHALRLLGKDHIQSLDEATDYAQAVKSVFDTIMDESLSKHPWNCNRVRKILSADAEAPLFGWERQFTLPAAPWCLKVWRIGADCESTGLVRIPFAVEGRKLLTDEPNGLPVIYGSRVTDFTKLSAWVAAVIAHDIAETLALRITGSVEAADRAEKRAARKLSEARSSDAHEGTPEVPDSDEIVGARD